MKPVLLTLTAAALVAVAACNRADESANTAVPAPDNQAVASQNGAAPEGQQVAMLSPQEAYDVRHERYEEMGDSFKAINRELKGGAPDVPRIQREAAALATLATQIPGWFPTGSGPDVHARSRAKAEIWSDAEGFRRAHTAYLEQVQRFQQVAQGGDVNAIRPAAGELGKSCSNCHDKYRAPER